MTTLEQFEPGYADNGKATGRYLDIKREGAGIMLILTKLGRDELQENMEQHPEWNDVDHIAELLGEFLGNGWEYVSAEECSGLTGCQNIIAFDVERGEQGKLVAIHGECFWHERYAIELAHERLRDDGKVFFLKA